MGYDEHIQVNRKKHAFPNTYTFVVCTWSDTKIPIDTCYPKQRPQKMAYWHQFTLNNNGIQIHAFLSHIPYKGEPNYTMQHNDLIKHRKDISTIERDFYRELDKTDQSGYSHETEDIKKLISVRYRELEYAEENDSSHMVRFEQFYEDIRTRYIHDNIDSSFNFTIDEITSFMPILIKRMDTSEPSKLDRLKACITIAIRITDNIKYCIDLLEHKQKTERNQDKRYFYNECIEDAEIRVESLQKLNTRVIGQQADRREWAEENTHRTKRRG